MTMHRLIRSAEYDLIRDVAVSITRGVEFDLDEYQHEGSIGNVGNQKAMVREYLLTWDAFTQTLDDMPVDEQDDCIDDMVNEVYDAVDDLLRE